MNDDFYTIVLREYTNAISRASNNINYNQSLESIDEQWRNDVFDYMKKVEIPSIYERPQTYDEWVTLITTGPSLRTPISFKVV